MSNGKDMLQEAVKVLYKEGKKGDEIRSIFNPIVEKNERIYTARSSIVQAIFMYINAVHSDMFDTYTKENLETFVTDQIFGTIDKDLDELRTLRDAGYKKVASTDSCKGTNSYNYDKIVSKDDDALQVFLGSL